MDQADSVLSTPPTNTSAPIPQSSRRSFLVHAAGVKAGGAAIGATLPLPTLPAPTLSENDQRLIAIAKLLPAAVAADDAVDERYRELSADIVSRCRFDRVLCIGE